MWTFLELSRDYIFSILSTPNSYPESNRLFLCSGCREVPKLVRMHQSTSQEALHYAAALMQKTFPKCGTFTPPSQSPFTPPDTSTPPGRLHAPGGWLWRQRLSAGLTPALWALDGCGGSNGAGRQTARAAHSASQAFSNTANDPYGPSRPFRPCFH